MVLLWKKTGDKAWRKMTSGQVLEVPGTTYGLPRRPTRCPERDTKYTFLVSKTFDDSQPDDEDHVGSGAELRYKIAEQTQPLDPACEPVPLAVPPPAPVHASMTRKCNKYTMGDTITYSGCSYTLREAGVSHEDFFAWNPFLEGRCGGVEDYAYCIGVST